MHLMSDAEKQAQDQALSEETVRRLSHNFLSEDDRLENALRIWIRDMRDEQLELVKKGGRLSVAALGYEEVLKLRGILGRFLTDRKRRIQGRWDRRRERRDARGTCLSCVQDKAPKSVGFCTAGRQCVAAGRDTARD